MVDFRKLLREERQRLGLFDPEASAPRPGLLASGPIKAWFKSHKGKIYSRMLTYEIFEQEHGINLGASEKVWTVFRLIGGPTGHESFVLADERRPIEETREGFQTWGYWSACAGNHVYEECRVHASELDRVLDAFIASRPDEKLYQD